LHLERQSVKYSISGPNIVIFTFLCNFSFKQYHTKSSYKETLGYNILTDTGDKVNYN